jgi:hypothetical protein
MTDNNNPYATDVSVLRSLHISTRGRSRFGSCFVEDCRIPRSYTLSTGVSSRGTRGRPTFQIQGRIQITVDDQATNFTLVHALAQIELGFDVPTARTPLAGRVEPIGKQHLTPVPLPLIAQLPPELVPPYISNCLRQVMVFHHPAHVQVFQHNG